MKHHLFLCLGRRTWGTKYHLENWVPWTLTEFSRAQGFGRQSSTIYKAAARPVRESENTRKECVPGRRKVWGEETDYRSLSCWRNKGASSEGMRTKGGKPGQGRR